MKKELRIPHAEIKNPQTITRRNVQLFRENDLSIHEHEVDEIIDDDSLKQRIYKVRKVKYFDLGRSKK